MCSLLNVYVYLASLAIHPEQPDVNTLIARFRQQTNHFSTIRCEIDVKLWGRGRSTPDASYSSRTSFRLWQNPSGIHKLSRTAYPVNPMTQKRKPDTIDEFIVCDQHVMMLSFDSDGRPTGMLAEFKPARSFVETKLKTIYPYQPFLMGKFGYNQISIQAIIESSHKTVSREILDGRSHWLLTSKGSWGIVEVWFDPEYDLFIRQIRQKKAKNDLNRTDATLSQVEAKYGGPIERVETTLAARGNPVFGKDVAVEYTYTNTAWKPDGSVFKSEYSEARFQKLEINSELTQADFQPISELPNGLDVTIVGQEGIRHEWRDGKIVKSIKAESVAALKPAEHIPGTGWGAGTWALLGVAISAFVLGAVVKLRRGRAAA